MPMFDYQCKNCGKTYEQFHKGAEKPETVSCPDCGSNEHKRLMSAPAISMSGGNAGGSQPMGGGCSNGMCGLN